MALKNNNNKKWNGGISFEKSSSSSIFGLVFQFLGGSEDGRREFPLLGAEADSRDGEDGHVVRQLVELGRKILEEAVGEGRVGREPGRRLELKQFGRQIFALGNVVEARESVAQPLRPVKVEPLRLVERKPRHARPRRFRRRSQDFEDALQLIRRVLDARKGRAARQQLHKNAPDAPQICAIKLILKQESNGNEEEKLPNGDE